MVKTHRFVDQRRVLFLGDIHGEWVKACELAQRVAEASGPLDAIFTVGDAEPVATDEQAAMVEKPDHFRDERREFAHLLDGTMRFPTLVHMIGGNHEPWPLLEQLATQSPASPARLGASGVLYMGRSGITEVAGLRVAFLSGIYSGKRTKAGRTGKVEDLKFFTRSDLAAFGPHDAPVDILLTHDWPDVVVRGRGGESESLIGDLTRTLRPSVHVAGHRHVRGEARMAYDNGDEGVVLGLDHVGRRLQRAAALFVVGNGFATEEPLDRCIFESALGAEPGNDRHSDLHGG